MSQNHIAGTPGTEAGIDLDTAARALIAAFDDPTCSLASVNSYVRDLERALARRAAPDSAQAAVEEVRDPIRKLVAEHAKLLEENSYTYFKLAYTRRTEWMAWLCTNARESDPNRKVFAQGQGSTPEEACESALAALKSTAAQAATEGDKS